MILLPDDFIPSDNGVQILQAKSENYSYEITNMLYNGQLRFAISVVSIKHNNTDKFYMIYSNELNIRDIISYFEGDYIKFKIVYIGDDYDPLNKVVHTPIKDFLDKYGPASFDIEYTD